MIIFPHIPKTSGTSIRLQLEKDSGIRVLYDYFTDYPLSSNPSVVNARLLDRKRISNEAESILSNYDFIMGHFMADKYLSCEEIGGCDLICFVRDPVERVISHYYFWKKGIEIGLRKEEEFKTIKLLDDIRNGMTLIQFARTKEMINFYKIFFADRDISDFSFIGQTERFDDSINIINSRFGTNFISARELITRKEIYRDEIKSCYDEIIGLNKDNYKYYEKALKYFW